MLQCWNLLSWVLKEDLNYISQINWIHVLMGFRAIIDANLLVSKWPQLLLSVLSRYRKYSWRISLALNERFKRPFSCLRSRLLYWQFSLKKSQSIRQCPLKILKLRSRRLSFKNLWSLLRSSAHKGPLLILLVLQWKQIALRLFHKQTEILWNCSKYE